MNIDNFRIFENKEEEKSLVLSTKRFKDLKVKTMCKKGIFEEYPDDAFIIVLDKNGKVILYEKKSVNTFNNLREFISLYGSHFFKNPITNKVYGLDLKNYYENSTGLKVREIYQVVLI